MGQAGNRVALRLVRMVKAQHWQVVNRWAWDLFGIEQLVTRGAQIQAIHLAEHMGKPAVEQLLKQGGKAIAEEGGKAVARESSKAIAKEGGKAIAKEDGKAVAKEGGKVVGKEGGKVVANAALINVSKMLPFVGGVITAAADSYSVSSWAKAQTWTTLSDAAEEDAAEEDAAEEEAVANAIAHAIALTERSGSIHKATEAQAQHKDSWISRKLMVLISSVFVCIVAIWYSTRVSLLPNNLLFVGMPV